MRPYIDRILLYLHMDQQTPSAEIITVNDKTTYLLQRLGFEWSELDKAAVGRMLRHWQEKNFI